MAKLTSKRFSEVARITTEFVSDDLTGPARYLWVMRSDGAVLRRRSDVSSSYTIWTKCTRPRSIPEATDKLVCIAAERGHRVVKR